MNVFIDFISDLVKMDTMVINDKEMRECYILFDVCSNGILFISVLFIAFSQYHHIESLDHSTVKYLFDFYF